mgnify:CR=1 FL=1
MALTGVEVLREAYLRKLHSDAKVTNYAAGRIVDGSTISVTVSNDSLVLS